MRSSVKSPLLPARPKSNEELGRDKSSNGPTGERIYLVDWTREGLAEPFRTTVLLSSSISVFEEFPPTLFPSPPCSESCSVTFGVDDSPS